MENNEAKKPQVLYMILTGRKLSEIATALDVSVRSIQRWLDEPEFADAVREEHQAARRIAFAQARTEMSSDLEEGQLSRTLLSQIRNDEKAPIHARIRCAALLIGRADRWAHALDKDVARETSRETFRESAGATPLAQKVRQKMTEHDTAEAGATPTVQKPRQKTTENDTVAQAHSSPSVLCDSAPLREPTQKPRQKTTENDTLPGDPPSPALQNLAFSPLLLQSKEQVLANLKTELEKLDQLENDVTERARARNIDNTGAMREFNEQIASARTKLIEAIVTIEEASPEEFKHAFFRTEAKTAS